MGGIDFSKVKATSLKKEPGVNSNLFDFLNRDIKLFGSGFSDKKKEAFYLELSILLMAGMDIKTTLEVIGQEQSHSRDKALIGKITDAIVRGATLSLALRDSGEFTSYEYFSLQIGEESGKIGFVLKDLASFYQKKIKQRRQLVSALTYPMIVLSASVGAVFFMINFIVPMFADIFKRFGGDLPLVTKTVLAISEIVSNNALYLFLGLLIAGILIHKQKQKEWFRKFSTSFVLRIPLFGEMIRKIYLARFCHSMTLLIGSKIPLLQALSLVKQMIGFYPIENSISHIEAYVLKGEALHYSLAKFSIYPKRMIALIKVGEEVNQLEGFFDKIAKQYSEDVEHKTSMIGSLIEPFMIIFLGLVVGIILIAMYLPLFNLSNTL